MKHIKPGRGPSAMAVIASIFTVVFGVVWTILAASAGAPWFFCLFGVMFVIIAVVQAVYHFHNATHDQRFSNFDIVEDWEEADPWDSMQSGRERDRSGWDPAAREEALCCPYCGAPVQDDFRYCPHCWKKLPEY